MVFSYIHEKSMSKKAFFSLVPIEIITDFFDFLIYRHTYTFCFDKQLQTTTMQKNSLRQL